jgi:hypothetical protein
MKDRIVEETRQARDAHAKQFNYDLDAICEDLRKREKKSGVPTVSLPPKRVPGKKKSHENVRDTVPFAWVASDGSKQTMRSEEGGIR